MGQQRGKAPEECGEKNLQGRAEIPLDSGTDPCPPGTGLGRVFPGSYTCGVMLWVELGLLRAP